MDSARLGAAVLIGIVAGLRAMLAPAIASWAAYLGLIAVIGTAMGFMASAAVVALFTLLALAELVTDQLPATPRRTVPIQFGARIVTGGLAGASLGAAAGSLPSGLVAGALGAVIGTLGGARARAALAGAFGADRPAALLEDAVAVGLGIAGIMLR